MIIGITGGTGIIGQQLLRMYAEDNLFFVATAQTELSKYYKHKNVHYVFSDYSTAKLCENFKNCECLVHLGAKKSSAKDEESIVNFYTNITSSEAVFRAALNLNIKNIINISSRCVYSPELSIPYVESVTMPLNNYGIAKLCTENIAALYNRKYNMSIKSLRVAQVISNDKEENSLFSVYLKNAIKGEQLKVFGEGKSSKEYIYIKDVCSAVIEGCKRKEVKGSFNIGTGITTSNRELADLFCEIFENDKGYSLLKDKTEDGLHFLMDESKTEAELGFRSRYSLKEALEDIKREIEGE